MTTEQNEKAVMDYNILADWYRSLAPRTVDLVGDFAGDELFMIDGDALMLQCFSNEKLDFSPGFQVLHATYLVEKILQKLQQRKCVFEIIFFAQNAPLCIPAHAEAELHDRYLLAREAIIQHLISVSLQSTNGLRVKQFESYLSESFEKHLINSGVYLFVCHDGAIAAQHENETPSDEANAPSDSDSDSNSESDGSDEEIDENETDAISHGMQSRIQLRLMINWFFGHGYNVALVNSLEFRDTKVMTMVIEGSLKKTSNTLIWQKFLLTSTGERTGIDQSTESTNPESPENMVDTTDVLQRNDQASTVQAVSESAQVKMLLEKAIHVQPGLTQRQCLLLASLAIMLSSNDTNKREDIIGATSVILHLAILQDAQLEDRTTKDPKQGDSGFFNAFVKTARDVLVSNHWEEVVKGHSLKCDLADLMDGRLFFEIQELVANHGVNRVVSPSTILPFNTLADLLDRLCGKKLQCGTIKKAERNTGKSLPDAKSKKKQPSNKAPSDSPSSTVLPFENAVFDNHLKPVHLEINESIDCEIDTKASRKFMEMTHWHSSKPLEQTKAVASAQRSWKHQKQNQRYMAEMRQYAESLIGSAGMSQPEIVVAGSSNNSQQKLPIAMEGKQYSGPKKKNLPGDGKPSVKETAALAIQQKMADGEKKQREKWKKKLETIPESASPVTRFTAVEEYLSTLTKDSRLILEPEILAYLLDQLLQVISAERKDEQGRKHILVATQIWGIVTRLMKIKQGISSGISKHVENVCQLLGLPSVQLPAQCDEPLSFKPWTMLKKQDINIGMNAVDFQLLHGGPFMERSMDSLPDPRTPDFEPDRWQRDVLDQIDAKKSAFIVAPTSAGKTFISFYAMRQVLKEDHDGVLVYVAPTKALVNQIAAEVQARFSKSYPAKVTGKSVWAIHTRDHRINNPTGCQILITVPHILQIMLLAPSNANAWTPRLRRIIFDEIHCIGQAEDGVVWEQLLLLSPCPIIALSATVGNPEEFHNWLKRAQGTNGYDLKMIQHQHRYSDLRKYVYFPPPEFSLKRLPKPSGLFNLGLDEASDVKFMHPVISLVDRSRGIPDDFSLEPRDCLSLWKAMHELQTDLFPIDPSLDPSVFFSDPIIHKKHVTEWQIPLKALLLDWMKNRESPFDALLHCLGHSDSVSATRAEAEGSVDLSQLESTSSLEDLLSSTLPLICSLHAQRALPALFFNYDRSKCEKICHHVLVQLQEREAQWKQESPEWNAKIKKWNEWTKTQGTATKKSAKATKKKGGSDQAMSRADQMRESASVESNLLENFDPEKPLDEFSLADPKKLTPSEFAEYTQELRWRDQPEWLIEALERGIGVHHAGMNRKYRQVCEILFRKGFLRVVIATGTLALGINMPCKTVVFSGDSIFLTALNFRQAAGRAGRRGFDVLGNVVFQQVPLVKIQRLLSSRLPDLNGHFPLTTSLVLRLAILLHGSKTAPSAVRSVNSILSNPRICLGGPEMKDTVLHYLRFSIEYLRQNHLLDSVGAPLNFAGFISHLYYTESSSFAFHALLGSGYFHTLCKNINRKPKAVLRNLMLVMSHIFRRFPLRRSTLESYRRADKRASSVLILPPLPAKAAKALNKHNSHVLAIYTGYVSTFIDQHIKGRDCWLPFSGAKCGGDKPISELGLPLANDRKPKITSPFYALSGQTDKWKTVSDLCETVRAGVWLEESVVPYVPVTEESEPLNAYLYDFFKHGNVQQLESVNQVRRGDMWFMLNDFSMILATLTTSLEGILNPSGNTDMAMLNVAGGGDTRELAKEDNLDPEEDHAKGPATSRQGGIHQEPMKQISPQKGTGTKSNEPADSWEDEMADDFEDLSVNEATSRKSKPAETKKKKLDPLLKSGQAMERSRKSLQLVCQAFNELRTEFDQKFKEMWA